MAPIRELQKLNSGHQRFQIEILYPGKTGCHLLLFHDMIFQGNAIEAAIDQRKSFLTPCSSG